MSSDISLWEEDRGKPNGEEERGRHVSIELETRIVWPKKKKNQEIATDSRRQKKKEQEEEEERGRRRK